MISLLSLFKYITHSSSLSMQEIKLFGIVSLIFLVSDILGLLLISFKYGLILLTYSLTDTVLFLSLLLSPIIVTEKITYLYWFLLVFFFFMLKRIFNISNFSIVNCFSFFFLSKKIFFIFN